MTKEDFILAFVLARAAAGFSNWTAVVEEARLAWLEFCVATGRKQDE